MEVHCPRRKDEEKIEKYVQKTHDDICHGRYFNFTGTSQHRTSQHVYHCQRSPQREDQEITRCIGTNVCLAAQPMRQWTGDQGTNQTCDNGKGQRCHQTLPEDRTGTRDVVCANTMGDLNRETCCGTRDDTPKQPGGRSDDTDTGRGTSSQRPHHGIINIKHQDGGQLCKDGRKTQQGRQLKLFGRVELTAFAYSQQEFVFAGHEF